MKQYLLPRAPTDAMGAPVDAPRYLGSISNAPPLLPQPVPWQLISQVKSYNILHMFTSGYAGLTFRTSSRNSLWVTF